MLHVCFVGNKIFIHALRYTCLLVYLGYEFVSFNWWVLNIKLVIKDASRKIDTEEEKYHI